MFAILPFRPDEIATPIVAGAAFLAGNAYSYSLAQRICDRFTSLTCGRISCRTIVLLSGALIGACIAAPVFGGAVAVSAKSHYGFGLMKGLIKTVGLGVFFGGLGSLPQDPHIQGFHLRFAR